MRLVCAECGGSARWSSDVWRCGCGGPFEFAEAPSFGVEVIDPQQPGLWRYRALLPLPPEAEPVTMGEGWTPLVAGEFDGLPVFWKLEFLNPTGSYKDRGIAPLMTWLRAYGVRAVVEDSSGNAGASVAAYAARAGIAATIFVPAHASPAKRAQIGIYGASVVPVPGPRVEATRAAEAALKGGVAYASHVWQPAMLAGLHTLAWEVWEQMGRRAPDWLVAPVGQGTLLLGAHRGFRALRQAGLMERMPRLVAVQAALCAPLHAAWSRGLDHVPAAPNIGSPGRPSVAEGIRIVRPVRGRQLLRAIRESDGLVLTVDEEQILAAQRALAHRGLYVEPTSAAPVAALASLREHVEAGQTVVVPLTGSGLKGVPVDRDICATGWDHGSH